MSLKNKIHLRRVKAEECGELTDKTVFINRVAKVVKGGRRFSFSALIVTGDRRGNVGFGLGKAAEVPDAIRKGSEQARKNMIRVPMRGSTVPHDTLGVFGSSKIMLKPASPGTGVIAGSVVRAVMDVLGVKDIRTKCIGSSNPQNVVSAVFEGLFSMKNPEEIASLRNMSLDETGYHPY